MIFPPSFALSVIGIADAGVPNSERLVLRPTEWVNLGRFGVLVGTQRADGVLPWIDNFFWFGEVEVSPPAWILLYTKPGGYGSGVHTDGAPIHSSFWNRNQTIFNSPEISAVVFEISALQICRALVKPPLRNPAGPALNETLRKALNPAQKIKL